MDITATSVRAYLHDHIPLSRAMEVDVLVVEPHTVVLAAPLAPNINHRGTAFGGSVAALATLAGWTLLHVSLTARKIDARLVIMRSAIDYEAPINGRFEATASRDDELSWERFVDTFERRGRARISVTSLLTCAGAAVGRFVGEFVAIRH